MNDPRWSVVVPVKSLAVAKTRLARPGGPLDAATRGALALAMALDVTAVALAAPSARTVVVVTGDERVRTAVAALGAVVVTEPQPPDLNRALHHGATWVRRQHPDGAVAALAADLPAATPAALELALQRARAHPLAVLADRTGSGTTLLAAHRGAELAPRFGAGSWALHVAAGAVPLPPEQLAPLRADVDTLADLRHAASLGLGPHTAVVAEAVLAAAPGAQ